MSRISERRARNAGIRRTRRRRPPRTACWSTVEPPVVLPERLEAFAAALRPQYDASLAAIPPGPAKDGGIATGNGAADAMIAARRNDGRFGAFRFSVGTLRRRVAAGAARLRQRPERLAQGRQAVPDQELVAVRRPAGRMSSRAAGTRRSSTRSRRSERSTARRAQPTRRRPRGSGARRTRSRRGPASTGTSPRSSADHWPTTRGCSRCSTSRAPTRGSPSGPIRRSTPSGVRSPRSARHPVTATDGPWPTPTGSR